MRVFKAIFLKEILAFLRSWGLVLVVLYSFTLDIYTAAKGIDIKPRNVSIGYVDMTKGGLSDKIIAHFHKPEFRVPVRFYSQKSLKNAIYDKKIIIGLTFENNFEKNFYKNGHSKIDVLLDATAASQAEITLLYLKNILFDMSKSEIPIKLKTHKLFNQNSNSEWFMGLSEMMSVITMLTLLLTAIVFVKEKEQGTWDIMLLMPVNSKIVIIAKAFSQVVIIMTGVVISVGVIIFGILNTPINGSFWLFMLLTFFFVFSLSGLGLFVAAISKSVMQVSQLSILIMMPLIFLSGAWTPIYAMNPFLQNLSIISPLRYYIEGTESIFFRGTAFIDLIPYFTGEILIGSFLFIYGFNKIGKLF